MPLFTQRFAKVQELKFKATVSLRVMPLGGLGPAQLHLPAWVSHRLFWTQRLADPICLYPGSPAEGLHAADMVSPLVTGRFPKSCLRTMAALSIGAGPLAPYWTLLCVVLELLFFKLSPQPWESRLMKLSDLLSNTLHVFTKL
jgi:hypothetical protein